VNGHARDIDDARDALLESCEHVVLWLPAVVSTHL
jgi:hypothetical protein